MFAYFFVIVVKSYVSPNKKIDGIKTTQTLCAESALSLLSFSAVAAVAFFAFFFVFFR